MGPATPGVSTFPRHLHDASPYAIVMQVSVGRVGVLAHIKGVNMAVKHGIRILRFRIVATIADFPLRRHDEH